MSGSAAQVSAVSPFAAKRVRVRASGAEGGSLRAGSVALAAGPLDVPALPVGSVCKWLL